MSNLNRIPTDELFMNVAKLFSDRSTCSRKQVGGVLIKDGRIIATGWNGVPSGKKHCIDHFKAYFVEQNKFQLLRNLINTSNKQLHVCDDLIESKFLEWTKSGEFYDLHSKFSKNELHCEENIVSFSAKHGISTLNTSLYITLSPCISCAKLLYSAGISEVVYLEEYDRDIIGINFLNNNKISCRKFGK